MGPTGEIARVSGSWLALERTLALESEGVMATATIRSTASVPVAVRVVEGLPASWAVTEVGVHPDHEPQEFEAGPSRIVFADVVDPDGVLTVIYGIRVPDVQGLDPPGPPVIEEAPLARHEPVPFGLTADGGLAPSRDAASAGDDSDGFDSAWLNAGLEPGGGAPDANAVEVDEPSGHLESANSEDEGPDIDAVDQIQSDFHGEVTDDEDIGTDGPDLFDAPSDGEADGEGTDPVEPIWVDHDPALTADPDEPAVDHRADEPVAEPIESALPDGSSLIDQSDGDRPEPPRSPSDGSDTAPDSPDASGTVRDAIAGAANVLVLADHADTADGCTRLLEQQVPTGNPMVLVSFLHSVDHRLHALSGLTEGHRAIDLVCMGEQVPSDSADRPTLSTPFGEVTVTSVADATDLVRLGVHVGRALDEADERPVLCLHSLSALVGLVDLQRVFRFIHVLSGRVRAVDGRAHYHLDPGTVDERAFATLQQLFEVVVRYEDGEFSLE